MPPGQASIAHTGAHASIEALVVSFLQGGTGDQDALDAAYGEATRLLLHRKAADLALNSDLRARPPLQATAAVGATRCTRLRVDGCPPRRSAASTTLCTRKSTPASPESPHQILSGLYEQLLRYSPRYDPSSGQVRLIQDRHRRKAAGCFYTPRHIARQVVEESLSALDRVSLPCVLDPAVGTGVFLLEAAHVIAAREGLSPAEVAERCLFGVDLDPAAREVSILSLWLETGARPQVLAGHILCADALALPFTRRFDLVIGNPPWGAAYSLERREQLKRRFARATRGAFDSFKLFLELGAQLSQGSLGMVVPQALLGQEKHADAREMLLDAFAPYFIADLGDSFSGVAAPAAAVVFGPKPGPATVRTQSRLESAGSAGGVRAAACTVKGGFPTGSVTALQALRRLQAAHPSLGDRHGPFRIRDVGINYNRASVAAKILYGGSDPQHADDIPRFRGRDFAQYTTLGRSGWLRHDPRRLLEGDEELSLSLATYQLPEKIVFRQTADRIVATLDRSHAAMGRSVIAITAEQQTSLRALLACLNSGLLTCLYRALAREEGRILPQVKVGRMAVLPVPEVSCLPIQPPVLQQARDLIDAGENGTVLEESRDPQIAWACLDDLADRLLAVGGQDARALALVETIVGGLYGIRPDEAAALGLAA